MLKNIVVLAGGISTERDVSLISGRMIYEALKNMEYNAILLDVYLGYQGKAEKTVFELDRDWAADIKAIGEKNPDIEAVKALRKNNKDVFFGEGVLELCRLADICFLALHGENGENGRVQAALDLMGIKYTGTDYVSSALSMDKSLTKELFLQNGIPTPKSFILKKGEENTVEPEFPCVVKVTNGGSSVGVYICNDKKEYAAVVKDGFIYDEKLLIEKKISGREFSIGVIGGKALPVIEIAPKSGFYDYKNKYQAGSTVETCPAEIPADITEKMQHCAERVFEVLRLKVYARMDFMMEEDGSFYCLEANTLPGMTPTSLMPQEAAAIGKSFPELCEWIMEESMKKYE